MRSRRVSVALYTSTMTTRASGVLSSVAPLFHRVGDGDSSLSREKLALS